MTPKIEERPITERVPDRPSVSAEQLRKVGFRQLAIRFIAGGLTSIAAGAVTLIFTPRVGGLFLAFPAILAASLTLIEKEEDAAEAREDARGAVMGGLAMAVFAAIAALSFGHLNPAIALLLAAVGWFAAAFLGYSVAWFK